MDLRKLSAAMRTKRDILNLTGEATREHVALSAETFWCVWAAYESPTIPIADLRVVTPRIHGYEAHMAAAGQLACSRQATQNEE